MDREFWQCLDTLIQESTIVIDRPRNSAHPNYPALIYPVDYGYLDQTSSMDGDGIDVWIGTDTKQYLDGLICVVDLAKKDSEIKLLMGCTESETETIIQFHNQTSMMKGLYIKRENELL